MSTTTRDPWVDARQVAAQRVLDRDLVEVRRRIWSRRVGTMVVVGAVLLGGAWELSSRFTPDDDYLWPTPWSTSLVGMAIAGVGLLLTCVAGVRATRVDDRERAYLGPEDFLGRNERAWVRTQISEGRAVAPERHEVVVATARRMRAEGLQVGHYLGLLLLYVGMMVGAPFSSTVIVFTVLSAWMIARAARGITWARRARRWLEHNDRLTP